MLVSFKETTNTQHKKVKTTVRLDECGKQQLDNGDEINQTSSSQQKQMKWKGKETSVLQYPLQQQEIRGKRKFEERSAEQKLAKRRIVMVDLPKPC